MRCRLTYIWLCLWGGVDRKRWGGGKKGQGKNREGGVVYSPVGYVDIAIVVVDYYYYYYYFVGIVV